MSVLGILGLNKRVSGAVTLMALTVVAASLWLAYSQRGESHASGVFGGAIAELQNDQGEVAATVNGRPISKAKLGAYTVFLRSGVRFGEARPDYTLPEYLHMLIDNELMYQEAEKRDLVPSDADVKAFAAQTKAGLLEVMASGTDLGNSLRDVFSEVEGTPYDIDAYDTSEIMLGNFRRSMAVAAMRSQLIAGLSDEDRKISAKRDAVVTHSSPMRSAAPTFRSLQMPQTSPGP